VNSTQRLSYKVSLKNISFSTLKVGDKVISATGKSGYISALIPYDDNSIEMTWYDISYPSIAYHHQCEHITYIGRKN